MRALFLITVGAFLLSIAIADNGNSMRLHSRIIKPHRRSVANSRRSLRLPPRAHIASQRIHRDARFVSSPKDERAGGVIAQLDQRDSEREAKSLYQSDSMMILEPVQQPRTSGWSDWMPDFFGDDAPDGPGPLIGPIDFPGLSRELYIRQAEPLDDDTNHVVVHLVNREPVYPSHVVPVSRHPQAALQNSYHVESSKDHYQQADSFQIPGKLPLDFDYKKGEYFSKQKNGSLWNDSLDGVIQMPNENTHSRLSVALLEQSSSGTPNIIWSRPVDRQVNINARSMNLINSDSNAASENSVESSESPLKSSIPIPTLPVAANASEIGNPRHKYTHPANMRAPGESIRLDAMLPQGNRAADEISLDGQSVLSRLLSNRTNAASRVSIETNSDFFAVASARSPRNPSSTAKLSQKIGPPSASYKKVKLPEGALHVVPSPNLKEAREKGNSSAEVKANATKGEEIMQRIMSMTSETWKEDEYRSTNKIDNSDDDTDTPIVAESENIERRIDLDVTSDDDTKESGVDMKEAVKKIMSTYALWRHKVVSTKFLKELDEKEKKRKKS